MKPEFATCVSRCNFVSWTLFVQPLVATNLIPCVQQPNSVVVFTCSSRACQIKSSPHLVCTMTGVCCHYMNVPCLSIPAALRERCRGASGASFTLTSRSMITGWLTGSASLRFTSRPARSGSFPPPLRYAKPRAVRAWRSSQLRRGVVGRVTHRVVLP